MCFVFCVLCFFFVFVFCVCVGDIQIYSVLRRLVSLSRPLFLSVSFPFWNRRLVHKRARCVLRFAREAAYTWRIVTFFFYVLHCDMGTACMYVYNSAHVL